MANRLNKKLSILIMTMIIVVGGLVGCNTESGKNTGKDSKQSEEKLINESDNVESGETRIVTDEFGEVEIPINPKRVAAIYLEDYLKALDVDPIVQWYHPWWGKQDYLNLDAPEFDLTGSMEALIDKNPDLIIVDGGADAEKYEQYSKVAPTYRLPEEILVNPIEITKTIADLLGVSEKADEVVKDYENKINDAKEKLNDSIGNETVAVVRLNIGENVLSLLGINNRFIGTIYHEIGLTPHPLARDMKEFQEVLSEEILPELDADHIIIFPSDGNWESEDNKEAIDSLESSIWQLVPAVQKGNVHIVDRTYWQSGAITANMMKIDDLLKMFVK
ncbi:ABC transporter substrate-binding protein [Sporosarcina sp. FSL K6-3457]|uniref:ABC transporter substrate-binding protein n=1 Tax=Sporosarcina sp. FSL K6-3457 TaxID=2978204 RepID=UPI0030F84641